MITAEHLDSIEDRSKTACESGELTACRTSCQDVPILLVEINEWRRALHSLTPGGSEFANNSAACVQHVRDTRANHHEAIKRGVRANKALRVELDEWRELAWAVEESRGGDPDGRGVPTVRVLSALCAKLDAT